MDSSRSIAVIEESQVGFAKRSVVEICRQMSSDETFERRVVDDLTHESYPLPVCA